MPRPYKDLSNPPHRGCLVGARCVFLQGVVGITYGDHLRKSASSAVRDSPLLSDGRSQQSGSVVVNLEVLTNRARHASPLHRFIEPTAPGMPRRHHRDGSRNCSVGAVYKPGEACLAPTQIYRTHRAWDAASAPVAFFCRASSSMNLRCTWGGGVSPVSNIRGHPTGVRQVGSRIYRFCSSGGTKTKRFP